jgi:PAS domain S-box-containing protein
VTGGIDIGGESGYQAFWRAQAAVVIDAMDPKGIIVDVNDLFCELCGRASGELIGEPLDMLVPPDSRRAHHHYRSGFMQRPDARPMGPDREVYVLHKNGEQLRVWIALSPIERVPNQKHVLCVVLPMDIGRSFGIGRAPGTERRKVRPPPHR